MFLNASAKTYKAPLRNTENVNRFHNSLPGFEPTRLISLDGVAKELGVNRVYLKAETSRLGLPAFKILGASWGIFRAITSKLQLPLHTDLATLGTAAQKAGVELFAATEGNHGRAVARFASILKIRAIIYVREGMVQTTKDLIASEGAEVKPFPGSYDDAVAEAATEAASKQGGLLIQDNSFDGYEEIPQWIVDGYTTLLHEIDQQLSNERPDLIVVPVGVGSLAQAVVSHYKSSQNPPSIVTVEPDTAACLYKSLSAGRSVSISTFPTIMAGLRCETVSTVAWPILQAGVDTAVTVSDFEAHEAVNYLSSLDVAAGPCGAAPLAALHKLTGANPPVHPTGATVVLICTEGDRDYAIPKDVSAPNEPVTLTQALVQIDSSNPGLSKAPGAGEVPIASYIAAWLEHRNIETHWVEATDNMGRSRPSIIGVVKGSGGGQSIMLNGHIDTVSTASYSPDDNPTSGRIENGKLFGRGAADMKSGVAAAMIALLRAKDAGLRGDVILAAVADEENTSIGTEAILRAGWRADGAVVSEPTDHAALVGHKGFIWVEVDIIGLAAHGSMPHLGVDAITKAGYFLVALEKHNEELLKGPKHPLLGTGSLHAGLIIGGEEPSSYPAKCTITVERRTVTGDTPDSILLEINSILQNVAGNVKDFKYAAPRVTFWRSPYEADLSNPFVASALKSIENVLGKPPAVAAMTVWTDCALLAEQGIPSVLFGVEGAGLHSAKEWATVESVSKVADVLTNIVLDFCR